MQDVYSNAVLNIAAGASEDSSGGCFSERSPLLISPRAVTPEWIGAPKKKYALQCLEFLKWRLRDSMLLERGWVLQERLLAPRVVYFGKDEVLWQCNEQLACESWPDKIPNFIFDTPRFSDDFHIPLIYSRFRDFHSNWFMSGEQQDKVRAVWYSIVMFYSHCQLSQEGDKLVAISGIAKYVGEYLHGEYMAGLWRTSGDRDFLDQLMWCPKLDQIGKMKLPLSYRAPSWPWAAVQCPIEIGDSDRSIQWEHTLFHIDEARVFLRGCNQYGEVTGAFLRVRCVLILADIFNGHIRGSFRVNGEVFRTETSVYWPPTPPTQWSLDGLFYMPIGCHDETYKYKMRGLILRRNSNPGAQEYTRCGSFYWWSMQGLDRAGLNAGREGFDYIRHHLPLQEIKIV